MDRLELLDVLRAGGGRRVTTAGAPPRQVELVPGVRRVSAIGRALPHRLGQPGQRGLGIR